jgi:hypothetical protein
VVRQSVLNTDGFREPNLVGIQARSGHLSSETFLRDREFSAPATFSAVNAAWYLQSLRTDSVDRGIYISFSTLAIVVLSVSGKFLFFFIPKQ